eukprot:scaffold367_cov254-Pinguiococcus_pyrenoidosus.AAC.6
MPRAVDCSRSCWAPAKWPRPGPVAGCAGASLGRRQDAILDEILGEGHLRESQFEYQLRILLRQRVAEAFAKRLALALALALGQLVSKECIHERDASCISPDRGQAAKDVIQICGTGPVPKGIALDDGRDSSKVQVRKGLFKSGRRQAVVQLQCRQYGRIQIRATRDTLRGRSFGTFEARCWVRIRGVAWGIQRSMGNDEEHCCRESDVARVVLHHPPKVVVHLSDRQRAPQIRGHFNMCPIWEADFNAAVPHCPRDLSELRIHRQEDAEIRMHADLPDLRVPLRTPFLEEQAAPRLEQTIQAIQHRS